MTRVMVVGFTSSGKTTYMAGMYDYMSLGARGFTLIARPADDQYLSKVYDDICCGRDRKWPAPSDQTKEYIFTLAYNFEKILQFSWLDYPGGELMGDNQQFIDNLKSSSALILLINGKNFSVDGVVSEEEYKERVKHNLRKEIRAVNRISLAFDGSLDAVMPPVILVISKSDLIRDEHTDYIGDVIRDEEVFGCIFKKPASGADRIVALEHVSLGDGIENGEDLDPINVEKPVVFSLLWYLKQEVEKLKMKIRDIQSRITAVNGAIAHYSGNRFKEWIFDERLALFRDDITSLRQEVLELIERVSKFSNDLRPMLSVFRADKSIYINGNEDRNKILLTSYFDSILSGI